MQRTRRFTVVTGWTLALLALVLLVGTAGAGAIIVPPRPGQVGIGMSPNVATLLDNGDLGAGFASSGTPGLSVQLRYRMRYERGFGLTWDQQELDVRDGARFWDSSAGTYIDPASDLYPKKMNLYLYGLEFYQMFDTRAKTVKLLSVGAGIAHPVRVLKDNELWFPLEDPGDGFFLSAGGSIERYFVGSFGADLSARYRLILHGGSSNHDLQVSLGLIWYASL
jgi:hypothetical protein